MRHELSPTATLFHADCRDAIKSIPDNSLDSCCTDPPYALVSIVKRFGGANAAPAKGNDAYMRASAGFMGKQWDVGETAFSTEFWEQVYRVLKPGAFVAAFGASRGYHRMACAIEDAGFEIRDSLMWIYGTGFPKSHAVDKGIDAALGAEGSRGAPKLLPNGKEHHFNIGFGEGEGYDSQKAERYNYVAGSDATREWEGWGTALKPAFEPIVLARKPLSEPTVAANVLKWRTGALNIDGCRVPSPEGVARVQHHKTGAESMFSGINGGTLVEPSFEGRWPANVVTDGSDEVVGMFPTSGPSKMGIRNQAARPVQSSKGAEKARTGTIGFDDPGGSAARFFYSAKASKQDRNGSKHPTVKPISLMQWLARLITPPGGTILDPFAGSGTTGAAAALEGFKVILCERESEYIADIKRRFPAQKLSLPLSQIRAEQALLPAFRELQSRLSERLAARA